MGDGATTHVTLTATTVLLRTHIDRHALASVRQAKAEAYLDHITGQMVAQLAARVATEELESKSASWPATWWDAVKQRWFPAWLLRRYPVRMESVRIEARALFPTVELPEHPRFIQIALDRRSWLATDEDYDG